MQTIYPRFSIWLFIIFFILYSVTFFCLWLAIIPIIFQLSISAILIMSAVLTARRYLFLSAPRAIIAIHWTQQGWSLDLNANKNFPAILLGRSVVTRYITILSFKMMPSGQRVSLLLLPDSLSTDEWRQLQRILFFSRVLS